MKVFVLIGNNGILKATGVIGVYATKELAEKDAKAHEYMLDKHLISEQEIQEGRKPAFTRTKRRNEGIIK